MKVSEENFVVQMQAHNEEALQYIIKNYGWVIKTVVTKHLRRLPWYQEECMNDVLLAAWNNVDRFDQRAGSFKNWLAGVAKYTALNYVRKYKHEIEQEELKENSMEETEYQKSQMEMKEAFEELISCLNERDRELFIQLYYEDESMEKISEITGVEKSVLYNRISRAKKTIRHSYNKG